jgi:hypothetical protein
MDDMMRDLVREAENKFGVFHDYLRYCCVQKRRRMIALYRAGSLLRVARFMSPDLE